MRLIDADALKECVYYDKQMCEIIDEAPTIDFSEQAKNDIATIIENEMDMRVIADRKHGKWIFENRTWFHQPLLKCSCCGRRQFFARFDYCPYCGARMVMSDGRFNQ